MRIVAGRFGGRKLYVPPGTDIRPTSDKVRGAIFNILHSRGAVMNSSAVDVFCGSGALGLEALSRGAVQCIFVDKNRAALDTTRRNAESFGVKTEAHFLLRDAAKPGRLPETASPATLALLDPPYHHTLLAPALAGLHENKWLREGALCVAEVEKMHRDELPPPYELLDVKLYKDTKILILRYAGH
jgi:16S rRNA (guanine966-N2)-methyltransferase